LFGDLAQFDIAANFAREGKNYEDPDAGFDMKAALEAASNKNIMGAMTAIGIPKSVVSDMIHNGLSIGGLPFLIQYPEIMQKTFHNNPNYVRRCPKFMRKFGGAISPRAKVGAATLINVANRALVEEIPYLAEHYDVDSLRLNFHMDDYWRVVRDEKMRDPRSNGVDSVVWYGKCRDGENEEFGFCAGDPEKHLANVHRGKTVTVAGVYESRDGNSGVFWHVFHNRWECPNARYYSQDTEEREVEEEEVEEEENAEGKRNDEPRGDGDMVE